MRRALWLACWLALSGAGRSAAEEPLAPRHVSAPFWQHARDPNAARAEALLRQGRALLVPALRVSFLLGKEASIQRRVGIENALARFERAAELTPRDPELLYLTGKALSAWQREAGAAAEQRSGEAIACFRRLREVDPWYEAESVAFELGVLYTREARFADAQAEYERALRLRLDVDAESAALGNLAEVTMLAGDMERAVQLYERAVREGSAEQRLLSLWGLAVALDRLGERARALEAAQEALRSDQAPMQVLEQGSVFFVPEYERFYYRGLGALGQARLGSEREKFAPARLSLELGQVAGDTLLRLSRAALEAAELTPSPLLLELKSRTLAALKRRPARAAGPGQPQPNERAERAAQTLGALIEAQLNFARYLQAAGEASPWAGDARAHLQELNAALAQALDARAPSASAREHRVPRSDAK